MILWLSASHRLSAAELPLEVGTSEAAAMPQKVALVGMIKEEFSWFSIKAHKKGTL